MWVMSNRSLVCTVLFASALVLGSTHILVFAAEPAGKEETWTVIYLGGQRIGYSQSITETVKQDGKPVVKTTMDSHMVIKRFKEPLVLKQFLTAEETPNGDLLRFRFEQGNPPAAPAVTSGIVEGRILKLTQEVNGTSETKELELSPNVKSPAYQDRVLKVNPMKPGETRTFDCFLPEFAKEGKVTLKAVGMENTKLLNNSSKRLFRVDSNLDLLPGVTTLCFQDEQGETLKASSNMLGTTHILYQVSKDEALKAIDGVLDIAISTLINVKPILKGHDTTRIVYRVKIKDQNPVDVLPVGDTQTIKSVDKETAELTVVSLPIPTSSKSGKVADEFLESSQYLQRDDERVQKHALKAAGDATDPGEIAKRMEKYVDEKLDKKNFSTAMASAGEVARTMEGDCTEHAMLLAAMLRVKGIPSRIVVGVVYDERNFVFVGHMWTEANLNEKWIPLDATRGNGGIGAAHIKLAQSSLSNKGAAPTSIFAPLMTVIGQMTIEVISAE